MTGAVRIEIAVLRPEGAPIRAQVEMVSITPLLAEALRRVHHDGPVAELLEPGVRAGRGS